jgi:hypothetical protein
VWPWLGTAVTPGKYFAALEQPRPALVGRDLFAAGHEEKLGRSFVGLGHLAVVEPVRRFVFVHDEFGVRKQQLPVGHVDQAGGMIRVHVGQQDSIDRFWNDPGRGEAELNKAGGGLQIVARSGVDDGDTAF